MIYLINTILGFLIAQISDILRSLKNKDENPPKLNITFFIKDTWQKLILSFLLSVLISISIKYNWQDFVQLIGKEWILNDVVFLVIGAIPELVLQKIRKKYGFLKS